MPLNWTLKIVQMAYFVFSTLPQFKKINQEKKLEKKYLLPISQDGIYIVMEICQAEKQ